MKYLLIFGTLVLVAVGVYFSWRKKKWAGLQEERLRAGTVRLPPELAARYPKPKLEGAWALYVAIPFAVFATICFYFMHVKRGYDAYVLLSQGIQAEAIVTIGGNIGVESYYQFEVDGAVYKGRGPERRKQGEGLAVRYDPANPSRNRPSEGLVFDALGGAFLVAALIFSLSLFVYVVLPPGAKQRAVWQEVNRWLEKRDFPAAVKAFTAAHSAPSSPVLLALADRLVVEACSQTDPEVYELAAEAVASLGPMAPDDATRRELGFYLSELSIVRELCESNAA